MEKWRCFGITHLLDLLLSLHYLPPAPLLPCCHSCCHPHHVLPVLAPAANPRARLPPLPAAGPPKLSYCLSRDQFVASKYYTPATLIAKLEGVQYGV